MSNIIQYIRIYKNAICLSKIKFYIYFVLVHPTTPVIYISSNDNNSSDSRNNISDLSNNYKRTKRSTTKTYIKDTIENTFKEGDNVTFMCAGNVGRPKRNLAWQKIYSNKTKYNYTNISSETISELCSYDGSSTLTIQVTGTDNQAKIRCIVESEVLTSDIYADTKPLLVDCNYNLCLSIFVIQKL